MLIVEDGSIVSGANSYVSLADAQKYLTDRDKTTVISDGLLLQGADYVNSLRRRYRGFKVSPVTSSMQFPRNYLIYDNQIFPNDAVPDIVIAAQIEAAVSFANNQDPYETTTDQIITKQKADVFEREFDTRSNPSPPTFELKRVMALLYPLFNDTDMEVSR